jgi:type I restriction enzyme S subunit
MPTKTTKNDWKLVTADDVCSLITNWFVGTATTHYTEDESWVLYIQWYNITEQGFNFRGIKKVTREFHIKNKKSCLKKWDLLTIQTGDVGLTSLVPKELEGSNCHALIISRFKEEVVYSPFMLYFYNSIYWRARLKRIETGSTMKHLNVWDLKDLDFLLPPLPEQNRIVSVLETWDRAIKSLIKKIEIKKNIKKGLLQEILTGKTRLKGFSGEWKLINLENFAAHKKYAIVDGPFGSQMKVSELQDSGIPLIEMYHLDSNYISLNKIHRFISEEKFQQIKRSAVFTDDLIISKTGSLGYLSIVDSSINKALITSRLAKISLDFLKADLMFFFFYLSYLRGIGYWEKVGQWWTMAVLSIKNLTHLKVPNISLKEQKAIWEILKIADTEIIELEKKLTLFKVQKKYLLNNLITGEIRTPENLTLHN